MTLFHATCVALHGRGLLITGASGTGKSDLALRLIADGAKLVADDQVEVSSTLIATCPAAIRGMIEARHVGVLTVPYVDSVPLALVIAPDDQPERLPEPQSYSLLGTTLPLLHLPYFHASTPAKLKLFFMQETVQR